MFNRSRPMSVRLSIVGIGHSLYYASSFLFDNVLYVYVVYEWGMALGGLFMSMAAFSLNIVTLFVYQAMKIDWIGSGLIRELRLKDSPSRIERFLLWANDRSKLMIFVILNVYQDPFVATAYFKEGDFSQLTYRDVWILVASAMFSNLYWIVVAAGIGNSIAFIWNLTG
jgi:hypothetical protein